MIPEPEYAQKMIVGVILHKTFAWYVTEKEYWYLDYPKFDRALLTSGYKDSTLGDYSHRFGIAVLNKDTIELFLSHMKDSHVTARELSEMMRERKAANQKDDLLDFAPCLLVNFDQASLSSQYPEMIRFELYVPDGWRGAYRDFLAEVPDEEKYWMVDGRNLFTST